jgi:hypothetical protein
VSSATSGWHLPPEAIAVYSSSAVREAEDSWVASVEAHLDSCGTCRAALTPVDAQVLDGIGARLGDRTRHTVQHRRPRRAWIRMFSGTPLPWALAAIAVGALAMGLDLVGSPRPGGTPSVLLLLAPILPLVGVGAAWAPRLDPMHEVTASTPSAGLPMLLRRTVLTLLPIVLASVVLGMVGGTAPPGLWLVPCLALTAGALALGSIIPLQVAATAVAGAWAALVLAPALIHGQSPALLDVSAQPGWLTGFGLAVTWVVVRRRAYRHASPTGR